MPRKCSICNAKDREKIDRALASGTAISAISREYSASEDSLWRHKAHISKALVRSAERAGENLEDKLRIELDRIRERMWALQEQMQSDGDLRGALVALKEIRGVVDSMAAILAPPKTSRGADSRDRLLLIVAALRKNAGRAHLLPPKPEEQPAITVEPIPPSP